MADKLRILLLATDHGRNAATMRDHVRALQRGSRHDVHLVNNYYPRVRGLYPAATSLPDRVELESFDAIVIHYTSEFSSPFSIDAAAWEKLKRYRGLKVLFLQDEYQAVDRTVSRIAELDIDLLFTCVPESEWEKVYPRAKLPRLTKVQTLTGFVPDYLLRQSPLATAQRPIDVGYRARIVPFWLGELGAEKWQIAIRFLEANAGSGLTCDISVEEKDRLYGDAWTRFLASCKATLGVESGASIFDFDGRLKETVDAYLNRNPGASFEEVQKVFLNEHEHRVRLNQISPRSFEAAALRTAMVMYEGEYSGILAPDRHYIALRKDFSNVEQVIERIKDGKALATMVEAAYEEIALNPAYSFKTFVEKFDTAVTAQIARRGTAPARRGRIGVMAGFTPIEAGLNAALNVWPTLPKPLRWVIKTAAAPFRAKRA